MKNFKLIKQDILFEKYGKKFIYDHLEHFDGQSDFWAYVSSPTGVIIVALDKDKNIVLVRQYRYTHKVFSYENPAGSADKKDKDFLSTAKRELLEETGYQSDNYIDLGIYDDLPGETDHHCQMFLALNCQYVTPPSLDPSEKYFEMSVELHPFLDIYNSLGKDTSLVKGTEHIAALFLAHKYLSDHNLL